MRLPSISVVWSASVALALGIFAAIPIAAHPHEEATAAAPGSTQTAADSRRVAVEFTYLLALPGERERMVEYIHRNWFVMDAIAKTQSLIDEYRVMDTGSDEGPWNVIVEVTYRDARGYEGVREAFEKIRAAHREVLIDGKRLRDLGKIVDSNKTFELRRRDAGTAAQK